MINFLFVLAHDVMLHPRDTQALYFVTNVGDPNRVIWPYWIHSNIGSSHSG